jgi:hypothetical protein
MSDKPSTSKGPHERVSLGEAAPASGRRSGVALARPGHFSAQGHVAVSAVDAKSMAKTGRKAVRATIKPLLPGRKDQYGTDAVQ